MTRIRGKSGLRSAVFKFDRSKLPYLLIVGLVLSVPVPPGVWAQEALVPEINADTRSALEEVLVSPDFGGEKPGWGIRFKSRLRGSNEPLLPPIPWMEGITRAFAWGLRFLLVSGVLVLGAFLFFRFRKQGWAKSPGPVQNRFVLPGEEKESPEFLLEKAQTLYGEGKIREAWAYCFSGAVAAFSRYRGLCFPPDATEYDCLALAPAAPGFTALVTTWVNFAYGGKIPPDKAFTGALDFCRSLLAPADFSVPGTIHE
ncbi:hypothetical protein LQZ21_14245 [Treponema sp. TIM-1]|uniref:hypothetical protein n=1 Tax=Treponema sp. TIM-1 TaxID=2898417 RepID=UPI003980E8CD